MKELDFSYIALSIKLVHMSFYSSAKYICAGKCLFRGYLGLSFVILSSTEAPLMDNPTIPVSSPTRWERSLDVCQSDGCNADISFSFNLYFLYYE